MTSSSHESPDRSPQQPDPRPASPDGLPGLGALGGLGGADLSSLLQQAQQMQQSLLDAQDELARAEVTGTAGGGLVRVTVTGNGEVTALQIDRSAIDPDDAEGLADLVLAAIRDAGRAAAELQQRTMGPLAEGLGGPGGLGLPGL